MKLWTEEFRPQKFEDVVGLGKEIPNSIKNGGTMHILMYGPAGTGKCVSKDSIINVNNIFYTFEEYEKIYKDGKDLILSENNNLKLGVFFKEKNNNTIKILLNDGTEIEGTPEHRIKILSEFDGIVWKQLKDINEKDICLVSYNSQIFEKDYYKINFDYIKNKKDYNSKDIKVPEYVNKDFAYFLGTIIGNGSIDKDGADLQISNHKIWLNTKLINIAKNLFNIDFKKDIEIENGIEKEVGISFYSVKLKSLLSNLGLNHATARFKTLPLSIRQSPKEIQLEFLKGLFDCDSHYNESNLDYYTASKKLCFMVRTLLMNMGFYCKISQTYLEKYDHIYWTVMIPSDFTRKLFNDFGLYKNEKIIFEKTSNPNIGRINDTFKNYISNILKKYDYKKNGTYVLNNEKVRVDEKYSKFKDVYGISSFKRVEKLLNLKGNIEELENFFNYFKNNNLICSKVKNIEQIKEEKFVYDFHIPENHTFICNNLINHNTTTAKVIIKELGAIKDCLTLNSSFERGIDVIREKVNVFAMTKSSYGGVKIVFLDEADGLCLTKDTEVIIGSLKNPEIRKIKDLPKLKYAKKDIVGREIMIPSYNFETKTLENDKGWLVDSGEATFYEIELEDGRKIKASTNHPFFNSNGGEVKVIDLKEGDEIIDLQDEIFHICSYKIKLIKIKSIKKLGIKKAYNITMKKNHNFLLGNGILTHNTNAAQESLKNLMEKYSNNCKFILTANNYNKIVNPIKSRCSEFKFNLPQKEGIKKRLLYICEKKSLTITDKALDILVNKYYPDIRRCINILQKLNAITKNITEQHVNKEKTFIEELIKLMKIKKFIEIREWILNQGVDYEEAILEFYKFVINNKQKSSELFTSIGKVLNLIVTCNRYINNVGWQEIEFENMIINIQATMKKEEKKNEQ